MKTVLFYKAISGYWYAEFPIKGESKKRIMAVGKTYKDLVAAIKRYEEKGYKTLLPYA